MKRIILTESQYRRLVKQKLNEYIVYSDPKDEYDATPNIRLYLGTLGQNLKIKYDINTYVSKIEDGIVYLVADKYNEEQKKTISDIIDYWVKYTPEDDEKIGDTDYFSGLDWDYGDEEIEDTEEIEDVEVKGEFGLDNLIDGEKLILYLISEKEAVDHSYDSAYPGKIIEGLSDLTIEEVKSKYGSGAKGRYQFLPKYFKTFADKSGLDMSDKFSPKNQDKMALDIFKDKMDNCLKLEDKLVRTWAALPVLYGREGKERYVNRGQSYYAGDGVNKAHIKADHFEKVLRSCGCDMSDLEEKLNDKKTNTINILIIGDSQSAGDNKYHSELDKSKYNVTNKSVGAKNTSWMLQTLKKQKLDEYDVVIIMGGGNDGYREITDDTAQTNLDSMYNYVKNNSESKLIAISNPTKNFYSGSKKYPSNELIAKHSMNSTIPDYKIDANSLGEDNFSKDKIHLNSKGHKWIKSELEKILNNL